MTAQPPYAELCRPPTPSAHPVVAAMTEAAARRYLRLMILADPERWESFVMLDTVDPIAGTPK